MLMFLMPGDDHRRTDKSTLNDATDNPMSGEFEDLKPPMHTNSFQPQWSAGNTEPYPQTAQVNAESEGARVCDPQLVGRGY